MKHLTKIDGVPNSGDVVAGMAYFKGSGPRGATCGDCKCLGYYRESSRGVWREDLKMMVFRSYRVNKCAKFKSMTGKHGSDVAKDNAACKFFEKRESQK